MDIGYVVIACLKSFLYIYVMTTNVFRKALCSLMLFVSVLSKFDS